MGYDTLYDPGLDDQQVVRLARLEDRILLTRDRQLAQRRGLRALLIHSEQLDEQIRQVLADLDLESERPFSRCSLCNVPLEAMAAEDARSQVPAYVAGMHKTFKYCPSCQRIYWRGSHWQQMAEHLSRLRAPADEPEPGGSDPKKLGG